MGAPFQVDRFYIASIRLPDGRKINVERESGAFPDPTDDASPRFKGYWSEAKPFGLYKRVPREAWTSSDIDWPKLARWYERNTKGLRATGVVMAFIDGGKIKYRGTK